MMDPVLFEFRKNIPVANDMLIWGRPGYQTMMTGASDPVSFFVKIKTETYGTAKLVMLWSSIFVTLMANKIGGLQFGIYRNCQISSRVFHTAVAALPLTKANRSDFE